MSAIADWIKLPGRSVAAWERYAPDGRYVVTGAMRVWHWSGPDCVSHGPGGPWQGSFDTARAAREAAEKAITVTGLGGFIDGKGEIN